MVREKDANKIQRAELAEERKASREIEAAIRTAQQEEKTYIELLSKAKLEVKNADFEEVAEQKTRIAFLEQKLSETKEQEDRAFSMAQQTKCGYIYVISNEGCFGEGAYKIGLTRRLDPMVRVKELGDASVPFTFDVHGIIYSQNVPELESMLHKEF